MEKKAVILIFFLFLIGGIFSPSSEGIPQEVQNQIEKAKVFRDVYPLISETDLACSFYIFDELPQIRIIASEKGEEKTLLNDSDIFYVDKGQIHGLKEGQVFIIVEVGPKISGLATKTNYGYLGLKHGRASLVRLEDYRGIAKVEKACGPVMIGNYLIPFEEKEGLMGKDLGYNVLYDEAKALTGTIIYLEKELIQIGSGQWALIDLGAEDGIEVGQQLTIFRRIKEDLPYEAVGNCVVIHAGRLTSTVKILSCKDVVKLGYEVQMK